MESKEYFEKVMQDYNQNRKGRSLRKYCKDEAVDYDWLIEFKKSYRSNKLQSDENKKLGEGEFIALTVEENFVPEQQKVTQDFAMSDFSLILVLQLENKRKS